MRAIPISVTVLTKNSEKTLKETLLSLQLFAEVIVADTGSTDQTQAIAKEFPNVSWHTLPFSGFGKTHNEATALASFDWVLSIDSDETVSQELQQELQEILLDPQRVYSIERRNFFNGKWIRGCSGWYPDRILRLYHRKYHHFSNDLVHEKIVCEKKSVQKLQGFISHTSYRSISDFLQKMEHYSTLSAEKNQKKRVSYWGAILRGWVSFFISFFWKQGFRAGVEGYIISKYISDTTCYKYLKSAEKWSSKKVSSKGASTDSR